MPDLMIKYRFVLSMLLGCCVHGLSGQVGKPSVFLFTQYQFATNTRPGGEAISLSNGQTLNSRVNYSLANGLLLHGGWSFESDSMRAGWTAGLRLFEGMPARTAEWNSDSMPGSYAYSSLRFRSLAADLGGFVHYGTGRLHFRTSLGLVLPVWRRAAELTVWNMPGFNGEEQRTITYRFSPGFRAAQEMRLAVSGHVWLLGGIEFGLTGAARKSRVLSGYTDSRGKDLAAAYPYRADRETDYLTASQWENAGRINDPLLSGYIRNEPRQAQTLSDPTGYWAIRFGLVWFLKAGG